MLGEGERPAIDRARETTLECALRLEGIRAEREAGFTLVRQRVFSITLAGQRGRQLKLTSARLTQSGA